MSLMDSLTKMAASQLTNAAVQHTGLTQSAASAAMPMAMAAVLNAMKNHASTPQGAGALAAAIQNHDATGAVQAGSAGHLDQGAAIIGQLFGGKSDLVAQTLAKAAGGIDPKQAGGLLAMAAPLVMGQLKSQAGGKLDPGALAGLLKSEVAGAASQGHAALPGLLSMLDANHDGSIADDAVGIGKKLLGGLFGSKP